MKKVRKRVWVPSVTVIVLAAGAIYAYRGCTSVPEGWQTSAPPAPQRDLMAGEWEGSWSSDKHMGSGKLTAVIEKLPDANYHASFESETPLKITAKSVCTFHISSRAGGVWEFSGKENLGLLQGGTYKYKGTVDGNDFDCTYDSTFDKGVFRMKRK
jgi:hypothetical protein